MGHPSLEGLIFPLPACLMSLVSRLCGIFTVLFQQHFIVLLVTVPNCRVSSQVDEEFLLGDIDFGRGGVL